MASIVRPVSDVAAGGWTTHLGGTTNLFAVLDEAAADDADYIRVDSPTGQTYKAALGTAPDPQSSSGHILRYRLGKTGTENVSQTVSLRQGSTEIASWSHPSVGALALFEQTLTGPQADAITDYSALQVWVTAASMGPGSFRGLLALTG